MLAHILLYFLAQIADNKDVFGEARRLQTVNDVAQNGITGHWH
jgi:hypothetical protein